MEDNTIRRRFSGAYGRAVLLAMTIWTAHFWAIVIAFWWLPLELLVIALPMLMGSAVILVWQLEQKVRRTEDEHPGSSDAWFTTKRYEPVLPQPQSGWTWQSDEHAGQHELADDHIRRDAA